MIVTRCYAGLDQSFVESPLSCVLNSGLLLRAQLLDTLDNSIPVKTKSERNVFNGTRSTSHVHVLLSVPPRYSIAMTVGYLKGKSAIRIHRDLSRVKGTLFGRSSWVRGYCASTVGLDESAIRQYIQDQEQHQQNQEQDKLNVT